MWKIVLAGVLVLIAIGIFKFVLIIKAKPKVTTDYLAEYNKISQPENYDSCQNAAPLYQEAFDSFFKMPCKLAKISAEWPSDFNQIERDLLEKWLVANTNCLQKLRAASLKPYFWTKGFSLDGLLSIEFPEQVYSLNNLMETIIWNAKVDAVNGKHLQAFDDVLACYRSSFQRYTSPCLMFNLINSMQQQGEALRTASLILKKTQVPVSALNSFQQDLEEISDTHTYIFDFTAEILALYDVVQRTYVYKPDESGLLSWGHKSEYYTLCGDSPWPIIKSCFIGPTQKEVKSKIDSYYEQLTAAYMITPWQLNQTQPDFFEKIRLECQRDNLVLYVYGTDYRGVYYNHYKIQAQLEAILTTISVLRFQQDRGRIPNYIDELVKDGYLKELPKDPYSDRFLIYKIEGENFKIYSVGMNFNDDGGKGYYVPTSIVGSLSSDLVLWPPWERPKRSDPNQPIQKAGQPE